MAEKPFVLAVDDDKASIKLMSRYLDVLGYACQTALIQFERLYHLLASHYVPR